MVKLFKLVLFVLIIGLYTLPSYSKSITFTVISDTHLKSDKKDNTLTPSIDKMLKTVNDVNLSGSKFVVFLGDNINNPDKYDLVMFAKVISKYNKPLYVAIGNHDVARGEHLDKKEYYRVLNKFSPNKIKKVPCVKKTDGFVFVFMDGVNQLIPGPRGYYREDELIWLNKILKKYKDNKVVILQHFPILPPAESSTRKTHDEVSYFNTLKGHSNVVAIISGHYHINKRMEDESGIVHLSVPSLFSQNEYVEVSIETKGDKTFVKSKILDIND